MSHLLRMAENKNYRQLDLQRDRAFLPGGSGSVVRLQGQAPGQFLVSNCCLWLHHYSCSTSTAAMLCRGKFPVA